MLRQSAYCLVAAVALNWFARTETGANLAAAPVANVASLLDSTALILQGSNGKLRTHLGTIERIADFRADDAIRLLSRSTGLLWVTRVKEDGTKGLYTCTATVIAADKIITNRHCVPNTKSVSVEKIQLWLNHTDVVTADSYDVDVTPLEQDEKLDYAILNLLPTPGTPPPIPLPALHFRNAVPGERLIIIHHSNGDPLQVTRAFCHAEATRPIIDNDLAHSCATHPGSSGSLVLSEQDGAVVGQHTSIRIKRDRAPGYATAGEALLAKSAILRSLTGRRIASGH